MKEKEAWDMMHGNGCRAKSLSDLLGEMGFSEDTYMVVSRTGADLKVADSYEADGTLKANDYRTFGASHYKDHEFGVTGGGKQEVIRGHFNDFEVLDQQMAAYSHLTREGSLVNGMTGSNNGVYAAMANMGNEMIITKDKEIITQLERQLDFAPEKLGVPLSNGGIIIDPERRRDWNMVGHRCEQLAKDRARGTVEPAKFLDSPFKKETNSNLNVAAPAKGMEM